MWGCGGCCYDGGWEVGGLNCGRVFQSYKKEDCMEVIKTKVVVFSSDYYFAFNCHLVKKINFEILIVLV